MDAEVKTTSVNPARSIALSWKAIDGANGMLLARLPSGEAFLGPYAQRVAAKADPSFPKRFRCEESDSESATSPQIARHGDPSGHSAQDVNATMRGSAGGQMACHFCLNSDAAGMAGGGVGECVVRDFGSIGAFFPPE